MEEANEKTEQKDEQILVQLPAPDLVLWLINMRNLTGRDVIVSLVIRQNAIEFLGNRRITADDGLEDSSPSLPVHEADGRIGLKTCLPSYLG